MCNAPAPAPKAMDQPVTAIPPNRTGSTGPAAPDRPHRPAERSRSRAPPAPKKGLPDPGLSVGTVAPQRTGAVPRLSIATISPQPYLVSATTRKYIDPVIQVTAPARRCRHGPRRDPQEVVMRVYIEVVLTIIGLLGAYVALLPLIT
jgi:hypothetical protein